MLVLRVLRVTVAPIGREHDEATVKNGIDEKRDEAEQKIVKALEV